MTKPDADVSRKRMMLLTSDYEIPGRGKTRSYTVKVSHAQKSKVSPDEDTSAFPPQRARMWNRLYFRTGLTVMVAQAEETTRVSVDPGTGVKRV